MLKKLYQKDGIIMIFNSEKNMDYSYFCINNYHKKKDKKDYLIQKGFTYLNSHSQ